MKQIILLPTLILLMNYGLVRQQEIKNEKTQKTESPIFNQNNLRSKTILDGAIKILIPNDFVLMDGEMLNLKYPKINRPTLVYTDSNGEVNIAFNYTQESITNADIPKIKTSILNQMKQVSSINLIDSELKNINNKEFFIIKFYSEAVDTKVYNLMFGTELKGRLLMSTFNCTIAHYDEWHPTADEILNSIEVL